MGYPGGRIMFVCEVCGVFINSTDNEARRAYHYNGKQYLGWKAIRDKLKDLEEKVARTRSELCGVTTPMRGESFHLGAAKEDKRMGARRDLIDTLQRSRTSGGDKRHEKMREHSF